MRPALNGRTWKCGRADYCTCLENRRLERVPGFESLHFRKGRCSSVTRPSPSVPGNTYRVNNYSMWLRVEAYEKPH